MGLFHRIGVSTLPLIPRFLMRRLAARYIVGETLEEAVDELARLQTQGFAGVIDVLGEDIADAGEARAAHSMYTQAAEQMSARGIDAYVSIKPTHFGLRFGKELPLELYGELLERCKALGVFVRIEMEDHTTTDATLELFHALRAKYDNVGIVLQARLFRTPDDIAALPPGCDVRMVKGIYLEPESMAHTAAEPIREAFVRCTEQLWDAGHTVALATHDDGLADRLLAAAQGRSVPAERRYFEVLLGVRPKLWARWRDAGHTVRVYVPFGPQWRAYSTRRLRENPEMFGHVVRAFFGLGAD